MKCNSTLSSRRGTKQGRPNLAFRLRRAGTNTTTKVEQIPQGREDAFLLRTIPGRGLQPCGIMRTLIEPITAPRALELVGSGGLFTPVPAAGEGFKSMDAPRHFLHE